MAAIPAEVWCRPDWPDSFWARVDQSGGPGACWPYVGATGRNTSGTLSLEGQVCYAPRVAFELAHDQGGPFHHTCGGAADFCCNPAHLAPGRMPQTRERQPSAKITGAQADEIRSSAESATVLARRYGVARQTIHRIRPGPRPRQPTRESDRTVTYTLTDEDRRIVEQVHARVTDADRPKLVATHRHLLRENRERLVGLLRETDAAERAIAMRTLALELLGAAVPEETTV